MVIPMSRIQAPSASALLASAVEEFLAKAEAFLQNHYQEGSSSTDVNQILQAIANLQLVVNFQALEREFDLHCDHQDLEADHYDSAWF